MCLLAFKLQLQYRFYRLIAPTSWSCTHPKYQNHFSKILLLAQSVRPRKTFLRLCIQIAESLLRFQTFALLDFVDVVFELRKRPAILSQVLVILKVGFVFYYLLLEFY